jgi:site-specific recombinase XerD
MQTTITIKPIIHRNEEQLAIIFSFDKAINYAVRSIKGIKWSQTYKCWYIPLSRTAFDKLKIRLSGHAVLETTELKKYLEEKNKQIKKNSASPAITKPVSNRSTVISAISPVNNHVLPAMEQLLKLKAFSASTIRTYMNEMAQLLNILKDIPADELTPELLKRYLVFCYEQLGLKENTLHSRINAMKFYYEKVLGREKFFWEIPRPKKQLILPKVLGEKEIAQLFNCLVNKKHKAILFTAYSAGLRVSEVTNLKLSDIDSDRMQIFIENAKGKKDRYVTLSPILLEVLRNYIKELKPRPLKFLFEGEDTGEPYPARTAQKVFQRAKEKAGINKTVSFHCLRHSFATHL